MVSSRPVGNEHKFVPCVHILFSTEGERSEMMRGYISLYIIIICTRVCVCIIIKLIRS